MKDPQVRFVLIQVMQRMFEDTGLELLPVADHDHGVLVVVLVREAGLRLLACQVSTRLTSVNRSSRGFLCSADLQFCCNSRFSIEQRSFSSSDAKEELRYPSSVR